MGGVILNADSIQLYKGLPLLTAQPSEEDRSVVPHRLYEILDETAPAYSATAWVEALGRTLLTTDAPAILVGGTGFYLLALTQGLSPIPEIPQAASVPFEAWPTEALMAHLSDVDPERCREIQAQDRRRLIRALSVWSATGRTLSSWQTEPRIPFPARFQSTVFLPSRDILLKRIEARLHQQVEQGVFEEVRDLKTSVPHLGGVTRALGFQAIVDFWNGQCSKDQAIQRTLEQTRQYAKRQTTWFRHQRLPSASVKDVF
jgi:tRNA dimethylallyltransferase